MPVPANSRPIRPAINGTGDVGKVVSACSTVDWSTGGTMALMSRCRRSGFADQHPGQDRHPEQQQREDAEEAVYVMSAASRPPSSSPYFLITA